MTRGRRQSHSSYSCGEKKDVDEGASSAKIARVLSLKTKLATVALKSSPSPTHE